MRLGKGRSADIRAFNGRRSLDMGKRLNGRGGSREGDDALRRERGMEEFSKKRKELVCTFRKRKQGEALQGQVAPSTNQSMPCVCGPLNKQTV